MVKTKIALLSVRSIVDNCLEAHGWFLWGLPGTGPSPCGQEVTKRKAAAIKIQSLLAKISCMYECLNRRWCERWTNLLSRCFDVWQWSSHVPRMCFDVDTLDQIRTAAKGAVEKFPVTPFHLEMAASSTRAGELGLDSQGLLAERSETPRFCSAYRHGTQQSACWQSSYVGYQFSFRTKIVIDVPDSW